MTLPAEAKFAAIIAAGGSGTRFAGEKVQDATAKQFLSLRGLPLYAWSLLALSRHQLISHLVLVVPSQMVQAVKEETAALSSEHELRLTIGVVAGGATRQSSVFQGLKQLAGTAYPPEYVLIHDAARPFLDYSTVDHVLKKAIEYGACTVGSPVSDTIKRVAGGKVVETIPRQDLVAVQTPQAGKFSHLIQAHEKAVLAGFATTDDAALLEWDGHEVYVVEGPLNNLKITHPLDLILAEALADYLCEDRL
jgi:2-C-methyl-D-erythritol 4-phosphate cytidylyltransferase